MKKEFDLRYASDRRAAEFDRQRNPDEPAPAIYRADLLRIAKQKKKYKLGFRDIAAATNLSVGTVRDALDGTASKLEALWKLSRYFEIPWIALFDVDRKLRVELKKDRDAEKSVFGSRYNGFEIIGVAPDFTTPFPASSADADKDKCPVCGHRPHPANGCLNMESDNDCNCKKGSK